MPLFARRPISLVCSLVFALALALLTSVARADTKGPDRLVAVLEYVASDYPAAAASKSAFEIQEQRSFLDEATAIAKSTPSGASWVPRLASIDARIAKGEDVEGVQRDCRALVEDVVAATGVVRTPKTPPDLARGKQVFEQSCASCHGKDGAADTELAAKLDPRPTSFREGEKITGLTPFRVFNATNYGVKGTAMAPVALDDNDRWAVAFYVLSLRHAACSGGASQVSLETLARTSDDELAKTHGAGAVDCLRTKMPTLDLGAQLALARANVETAIARAKLGDAAGAKAAVLDAYLSGIEPVEPLLKGRDAQLVTRIEEAFLAMRVSAEKGDRDLEPQGRRVLALLEDARRAGGKATESSVFGLAAMIVLREGFEVTIVLAALLAVLKKMGADRQRKIVHAGWIAALFAGALLFVFARRLVAGSSREWMEGVVGLFAVAMLLYAVFWLNARSHTRKFMGELRDRMRETLEGGSNKRRVALGLFVVSFTSMLRETAETVIFLQGLALDSTRATAWGAVAGLAALLVVVFAVGRFGLRVPMKLLFDVSTTLLFATAVVMLGKAIHALQEVGIVPLRPIAFLRVDFLGIFPDAWSLLAQALLVAAPFVYRALRRDDSGPEPAARPT